MEETPLHYDTWIEDALRQVIQRALDVVALDGLPGDHHFYITFLTDHEDVIMPASLATKYPDEMTIVLQHQFDRLEVHDDGFEVTLYFGGVPTRLAVPFAAVTSFADPSVNFGLQLKVASEDLAQELMENGDELVPEDLDLDPGMATGTRARTGSDDGAVGDAGTGKVVALDAFRKK